MAELRGYLRYLDREARARFDAGMSAMDAAPDYDIPLTDYAGWGEAERVVANVETLYRGYSGGERLGTPQVMFEMAEFEHRLATRQAAEPAS